MGLACETWDLPVRDGTGQGTVKNLSMNSTGQGHVKNLSMNLTFEKMGLVCKRLDWPGSCEKSFYELNIPKDGTGL